MAMRVTGAKVNRSAARKAAEVAALRRARLAEHEAAVTEAVALYFDRSSRAEQTRVEAKERADKILADADRGARILEVQAGEAVVRLKKLGEPIAEIATMVALPVATVKAVLSATARKSAGTTVPQPSVPAPDASPEVAGESWPVVVPEQAAEAAVAEQNSRVG